MGNHKLIAMLNGERISGSPLILEAHAGALSLPVCRVDEHAPTHSVLAGERAAVLCPLSMCTGTGSGVGGKP